ncbi:MAG: hypothetical protein ABIZ04_02300 [Opitutus sp.]
MNLPYIRGALAGEKQNFERRIPLPGGEVREAIATYTPDIVDGVVRGFSVQVTDVTVLRAREAALQRTVQERDEALLEIRTLRGLLPICASCRIFAIRRANGIRSKRMFRNAQTSASRTGCARRDAQVLS